MGLIEQMLDLYTRLGTRLFTMLISSQFYEFGAGTRIAPPFRYLNLGQISLGERVMVHRDCWFHVLGGHGDDKHPKLIIQSHAAIGMGATISAVREVVIEEHVLLARNVYISDNGHAFWDVGDPIMSQGIDRVEPVRIGKNSWLCQNVCILPGVTIGQHCVIGANSVVNSSIPPFSVAVGSPARVVKRYNPDKGQWERT
jgi:acetyltransferase-like isoleucine patch superfamily enzyme